MVAEVACRHRWLLESPHGTPTVQAVCRDCKEEKEQPTSIFAVDVLDVYQSRAALRAMRLGRAEMADILYRATFCTIDYGKPERQSWRR